MPEYLSPAVYVEEVELGARPIEGVSTSTAGSVGVTERGPEDVPVLVTSFAGAQGFQAIFGGYLNAADNPNVWYLPHSVEGFFQNGGQRMYVVRVASANAARARVTLMDRGTPTAFATRLVLRSQQGDALLVVADSTGLTGSEILRIDDDVATEYVTLDLLPFPTLADRVLALRAPSYSTFTAGTEVTRLPGIDAATAAADAFSTTLDGDAAAGANQIRLAARPIAPVNDLAPGDILMVGAAGDAYREYVTVAAVPADPAALTISLRQRLAYPHADGDAVARMNETETAPADPPTVLSQGVSGGDGVLVVDSTAGFAIGDVLRLGTGTASTYHVISELRAIGLRQLAIQQHSSGEPVTVLTFTAPPAADPMELNTALAQDAVLGDSTIHLDNRGDLAADQWLEIGGGTPEAEFAQVASIPVAPTDAVVLRQPLRAAHAAGDTVTRQLRDTGTPDTRLLQHLQPDAATVLLADDTTDFDPGVFVEIGEPDASNREYVELGGIVTPVILALTPGTTVTSGHRAETALALREELLVVHALDRGGWGNELRVKIEAEEPPLVQTTIATTTAAGGDVPLASTSGVDPGSLLEILDFSTQLTAYATRGETVLQVSDKGNLLAGEWVRIGRRDPEYAIVAVVPAAPTDLTVTLDRPLRRDHGVGEWLDRMDTTGLPRLAKVAERLGASQVRFEPAGLPFPVTQGWTVRSHEFKLTAEWVKRGRANPRTPGIERIVSSETHRYLTLDNRHTRYVAAVVGDINGTPRLWDRRPDGQSDLVRVEDLASPEESQALLRPGPDTIYEAMPGGRRRPVGRWLAGGVDDNGTVTDDNYRGQDNIDPDLRTGLQALRNYEDISLVVIPGRVSSFIQGEMINHCELMRYRVAVLDSVPGTGPAGAMLPDVLAQRQQYDSKYAALYYPWLRLRNPFPVNAAQPDEIAVPPSGHVLGICARTDVTRGVHKAPANEVIAGIIGLQRALTKGEHDILNPFPTNINVLRDFREQNRGLRVWGARVISSDPLWRYLNVRRLFNFVERSLELGTQSFVFEPNDVFLWARVRRTISDFLTGVWRSGALMGTTAEEAYFVKCDETTMTQNDLDNGRLIVVVGIAPVKPAEFVIIRIGQWQGGSAVEEEI
jgi:phage tail sheath protein FI